jgi:hypothetical protein
MGASTVWNGRPRPFIPRRRIVLSSLSGRNYCGHKCWSVSLVLLGCSNFTFHGLYGWLTAYPTLPQPTVEA